VSKRKFQCTCLKDFQCRSMCTICFGLGISVSCFCPVGFSLFLAAVILVALGVSLLRN